MYKISNSLVHPCYQSLTVYVCLVTVYMYVKGDGQGRRVVRQVKGTILAISLGIDFSVTLGVSV